VNTLILSSAAGALLLLSSCSADQVDFKTQTETFIRSETAAAKIGTSFAKAQCEAPASTKVGTNYSCVATAADGSTWDFSVTIDKKNSFFIQDYAPRTG
jgi:hypothetical protein